MNIRSVGILGAGTMAYVGQTAEATAQPRAQTYKMLQLFGDVLDIIQKQYVVEVVSATRRTPLLRLGASPRSSVHLLHAAKALGQTAALKPPRQYGRGF